MEFDEKFVWWLWQTRRFDAAAARNRGFDVIFCGWPSTSAGPDFREAVIADSRGQLTRGDVEIHINPPDWYNHGHHTDPIYDNVILHVVLHATDGPHAGAVTQSGRTIPELALNPILTAGLEEHLRGYSGWRSDVIRCPGHTTEPTLLTDIVRLSGEQRFQDKVRRMVADVEAVGVDEALYRSLAESLGYSANRQPFRKLAEGLPFALLSSLTLYQIESLLLAAAGLSPREGILSAYIDGPILSEGELTTFRIRPGNSPATRLRGLARLIHLHRRGLAASMASVPVEELWRLFVVAADVTLVGKGRADDIVVNVALPYLTAYEGLNGVSALGRISSPADNRWVKSLRDKLRTSGVVFRPYRAVHQQGLLELALRFCRYDHCEACPLHGMAGYEV